MTIPVPGRLDRIRQVVGDKQVDGIQDERLGKILAGWQLATSLEYALIAEATGVTVLWLLNGHDEEDLPTVAASNPGTLGELRTHLRALEHLPDDTLVVLAASPEGVHYSPVQLVTEGLYEGDENVGEFYLAEDLRRHAGDGFAEAPDGARPALVLFPRG